jgi:hypothetical protein
MPPQIGIFPVLHVDIPVFPGYYHMYFVHQTGEQKKPSKAQEDSMKGLLHIVKSFFRQLGSTYKTVAGRSGGCGYIPPGALHTPDGRKSAAAKEKTPTRPD